MKVSVRGVAVDGGVHLVGTDVLGDATVLLGHDVGRADRVEQLGLAVVDVTHDGDDRRAGDEVCLVLVGVELDVEARQDLGVLLLGRDDPHVPAELGAEQLQRLLGRRLRRGHHLAELGEHDLDERAGVRADPVGEVGQAGAARQPDLLAVAARDLHATDRRRLHVVELLAALLLRLAAAYGPTARATTERTLGRRAATTAARTAGTTAEAAGTTGGAAGAPPGPPERHRALAVATAAGAAGAAARPLTDAAGPPGRPPRPPAAAGTRGEATGPGPLAPAAAASCRDPDAARRAAAASRRGRAAAAARPAGHGS